MEGEEKAVESMQNILAEYSQKEEKRTKTHKNEEKYFSRIFKKEQSHKRAEYSKKRRKEREPSKTKRGMQRHNRRSPKMAWRGGGHREHMNEYNLRRTVFSKIHL